jgi:hypothetical protein
MTRRIFAKSILFSTKPKSISHVTLSQRFHSVRGRSIGLILTLGTTPIIPHTSLFHIMFSSSIHPQGFNGSPNPFLPAQT